MTTTTDSVWTAVDTTPDAIEQALREMLVERHAAQPEAVPARVLNLVAVVDREWSGEIANRLRGVGRYQPSRTIVCQVEPRRTTIDATVSVAATENESDLSLARELVVLDVGPQHLEHLETIVDPLVVTDLPTLVWSPHGHPDAVEALLQIAQIVLLDTVDELEAAEGLDRAAGLVDRSIVVDLGWLRSVPWRERIAALFDPPAMRDQLGCITGVTVRMEDSSAVVALLLVGWLGSRLGWTPSLLHTDDTGRWTGSARAHRYEVQITLEPVPLRVRGLAGLTIDLADGTSISLDRGRGGLDAVRSCPDPDDPGRLISHTWTIMGASRGEGGILGEGIRQAMLRDPVYRPALAAARGLAS
jgi:glucose-6-phosphate dehydrogenase assembly protein OpcA